MSEITEKDERVIDSFGLSMGTKRLVLKMLKNEDRSGEWKGPLAQTLLSASAALFLSGLFDPGMVKYFGIGQTVVWLAVALYVYAGLTMLALPRVDPASVRDRKLHISLVMLRRYAKARNSAAYVSYAVHLGAIVGLSLADMVPTAVFLAIAYFVIHVAMKAMDVRTGELLDGLMEMERRGELAEAEEVSQPIRRPSGLGLGRGEIVDADFVEVPRK
ncbi:MAG: hypothetical protein QMC36_05095 [Patescibacteria group bacterium]